MAIYTVSNALELSAALDVAQGEDRIELAAGHYGDLSLQNMTFNSAVTIASADPGQMAEFGSIRLYEISNLTFEGILVDFVPDAETLDWDSAVGITYSDNITFVDSVLEGGYPTNGDPVDTATEDRGSQGVEGFPVARGFAIHWSEDITFENVEISKFKTGLSMAQVDGLKVSNSTFLEARTTFMSGANVTNAEFIGNTFSEVRPWGPGGTGDHADFVHFWTSDAVGVPNDNIVFRDNFFEQGIDGGNSLGLFFEDNSGLGFTNVVIENNVLHNGNLQGIAIENVDGMIIRDNTLLQSSGDENDAPGLLLTNGSRNILVENNVLGRIVGTSMADPATFNIVTTNNLIVQSTDPTGVNYVGDLYVNGLTADGEMADFQVIPGSLADGVGSSLTHLPPGQAVPYIQSVQGSALNMQLVTFSVQELLGEVVGLDSATVVWDFGNGQTAIGPEVSFRFEGIGPQNVQATIQYAGGSTQELRKTVIVQDPHALSVDFEGGFVDLTSFANTVSGSDGTVLQATELGQSVWLSNSDASVKFGASNDLTDNAEFTLMLDFKADANMQDGTMVYFSSTANIRYQDGELYLYAKTSSGETIEINSLNANLDGSGWHRLVYTFSSSTGTASFYLDGENLGEISGLSGAQTSSLGPGWHLGSPFGGSATAYYDNVQFLRGSLSESNINQNYQEFLEEYGLSDPDSKPMETQPSPLPQPGPLPEPNPVPAEDPVDTDPAENSGPASVPEPGPTIPPALDDVILDIDTLDETMLRNGAEHTAKMIVDFVSDRLQVVVDDKVGYDQNIGDPDAIGRASDPLHWMFGSDERHGFDGLVSDFRIEEGADFVEDMGVPDDASLVA